MISVRATSVPPGTSVTPLVSDPPVLEWTIPLAIPAQSSLDLPLSGVLPFGSSTEYALAAQVLCRSDVCVFDPKSVSLSLCVCSMSKNRLI